MNLKIILFVMILSIMPVSNAYPTVDNVIGEENNSTPTLTITPSESPIPTFTPIILPKSYTVKMYVGYGFIPNTITINISDTIVWNNEENKRPRVVLVSRDRLFEKQILQEYGRYQYQFNKSGNYTFAVAEYGTYKEYPNVTDSVIVRFTDTTPTIPTISATPPSLPKGSPKTEEKQAQQKTRISWLESIINSVRNQLKSFL